MFSQEQIRQALSRPGMQWTTPSGATGIPGYGFMQAPPVIAPPPPQVSPSQFVPSSGVPTGYAEMFQPAQPSVEASGAPGLPMATAGSSALQPSGAPPATGGDDPSMVRQALLNLIGNVNAGGAPGAPSVATGSADMTAPAPSPSAAAMPAQPSTAVVAAPVDAAPVPRNRPAALQGESSTYTIRKGDTLWALAKHYGTTVAALAKKNRIKNPNRISVGQTIKV